MPFIPRGRFAPSPTGKLHLGNARSALLGWLQARSQGGEFLLRVEDLDRARCRPEHEANLLSDLEYLGLTWDGPLVRQSERGGAYEEALERLDRQGRLYPCFCSRAEIARAATAPHGASDDGPRYPGTCARLTPEERAEKARTRRPALRFRPEPSTVTRFDDLLCGPQAQDVDAVVGDFVVRRNDGVASYQLAVVVDDASAGVTDVLRGDDLLASTPRQLQLIDALELPRPRHAHVPLLLGEDGKRLAKREGALAVTDLRSMGVPAEKVIGLLASWSGLGDGEPVAAADLVARFSLEKIPSAPVIVAEPAIQTALGV
ncbi:MAG TPA: tRNA glutamyl-Q(34) synthetase GluQRS [Myxococcaceae bacterium]|nr:tRNA glutamyl-Q(34) synthetase GluQRS [Myxococcaceae bacterium]